MIWGAKMSKKYKRKVDDIIEAINWDGDVTKVIEVKDFILPQNMKHYVSFLLHYLNRYMREFNKPSHLIPIL